MAELYGKVTGCCRGKGGSMHLGDPAVGMLPAIAIVAGGNSVVSGIGLAIKLSGDLRVAVCFFGEGATNEGAFHEAVTNRILDDLVAATQPRRMRVTGLFNVRGGITTTVVATHPNPAPVSDVAR